MRRQVPVSDQREQMPKDDVQDRDSSGETDRDIRR
jgi:hypothetical protein